MMENVLVSFSPYNNSYAGAEIQRKGSSWNSKIRFHLGFLHREIAWNNKMQLSLSKNEIGNLYLWILLILKRIWSMLFFLCLIIWPWIIALRKWEKFAIEKISHSQKMSHSRGLFFLWYTNIVVEVNKGDKSFSLAVKPSL